MKKIFLFVIALALFGVACKTSKKSTKTAQSVELKTYTDSLSYSIGVLYGNGLKEQGFDSLNVEVLSIVLKDVLANKIADSSLKINKNASTPFVNDHFIKQQQKIAQKQTDFLIENKTKPGVVALPSGLQYKVIKEGTGAKPGPTSNVTVHYTGSLIDGRVFDSSVDRGEPLSFALNGVIAGWTEGLQLMSEGAKYMLYIPAKLGYGERGAQGSIIGPNATLIFEVELLKVN
jgi:FKBP-type peptidyl-prolyl cis-trans isomerase FklB